MLSDLTDSESYPHDALLEVFERCLQAAIDESNKRGQPVDHLMYSVNSQLMDWPIYGRIYDTNKGRFQKINLFIQSIIGSVMQMIHEFEIADMSGRAKGRQPLLEERFTIDITVSSRKALKKSIDRPKKHRGSGKRKFHVDLPNIDPNALIKLPIDDDNLCLFRAIDILRAKSTQKRQTFHDFLTDADRQTRDVHAILRWCRISRNHDSYAVEDHG
jgi:hypothetical protein